ncbi:MAG: Uma2 family endonuclease [Hyphomicrobiaceae bacterium]|nr:Uma2 family endonuclease [Hyphomicrobiaceae bacterium]
MNQLARNLMSQDEFLLWCLDQEARYELVDGVPVEAARADTYEAETARMVVEVLSPSNRGVAWQRKLEDYHARDGLSCILIVESEKAGALLIHRVNDKTPWDEETFETMDQTITLPHIGCQLAIADIYDGIAFESA